MDESEVAAHTFEYAPLRARERDLTERSAARACQIVLDDYEAFEDAAARATDPRYAMVYCMEHATCHLYDRAQWWRWLVYERETLLAWLDAQGLRDNHPRAYESVERRVRKIRLRQVRLELPFFLWQRDFGGVRAVADRPFGVSAADYAQLTAPPLYIPAAALPMEMLFEFHQCARKLAFASIEAAEAYLARRVEQGKPQVHAMAAYSCSFCEKVHVGKPRKAGSSWFAAANQVRNAHRSWNTYHELANHYARQRQLLDSVDLRDL